MLAGSHCTQRPLSVQAVDERYVKRLHLGVVHQLLVGGAHARNGVTSCKFARTRRIATGDGNQPPIARGGNRRHHGFVRDAGSAQHTPPEAPRYMWTSTWPPPRAIECAAASITATVRRASSGGTARGSSHA